MDIRKINLHEHKINPKYGNIKSYINRINKEANPITAKYLSIIYDTLISLETNHNEFIDEVKQSIKNEQ